MTPIESKTHINQIIRRVQSNVQRVQNHNPNIKITPTRVPQALSPHPDPGVVNNEASQASCCSIPENLRSRVLAIISVLSSQGK